MGDEFEALLTVVQGRRSIRRFRQDPVPPALLRRVVDAARWAPSAGNRQSYRFLAVENREMIAAMGRVVTEEIDKTLPLLRPASREEVEEYLRSFTRFVCAPLVLVPIYRTGVSLIDSAADGEAPDLIRRADADALCSVSAATMCLLLAAHALGLGTCWMTGPLLAESPLCALLDVPKGWSISALIPMGYAAESPPAPPRRDADKLLRYFP
ncbi:MAG: nitroreductase family protein [Acidobacteriota bacterium]